MPWSPPLQRLARLALAWALLCAACAGPTRPRGARVTTSIPERVVGRAIDNGLNATLAARALSDGALADSDVAAAVRASPDYAQFVLYMIECALEPEQTVDFGAGVVMTGSIGLAPEWYDGACDTACQEWVTACLGARSNAYGVHVKIILEADHPSVGVGSGAPIEEGVFYGNIFEPVPRFYACRGAGYDPLMMVFRSCSQPGATCGMQWVGPCGEVDGDTGVGSERRACAPLQTIGDATTSGVAYPECWNRPSARGEPTPPAPFRRYTRLIRVLLAQTGFVPGCGGIPWDPLAEPRPDPLAANVCEPDGATDPRCLGQPCTNDDGCGGETYVCDTSGPLVASCTAGCVASTDQAAEAAACGGSESTCVGILGSTDPSDGRCGRRCAPVGQSGKRCLPSQVCTGLWFAQPDGVPDVPGCRPACKTDSDCVVGSCNARYLGCGAPVDMSKRRDGEPCRPTEADPAPCRGECTVVDGAPPGAGLCASTIDYADTRACPDDPATMSPSGPAGEDDALICIYRRCTVSTDCTAPLVCRASGLQGLCLYP